MKLYTISIEEYKVHDYDNGNGTINVEDHTFGTKAEAEEWLRENRQKITPFFGQVVECTIWESVEFDGEEEPTEWDELHHTEIDNEHLEYDGYKSLNGAIIVSWSWHRYLGYARDFNGVGYAYSNELSERDLLCGHEEYTNKIVREPLLYKEDIDGLSTEEIVDKVLEELDKPHYKWTCDYEYMEKIVRRCLE